VTNVDAQRQKIARYEKRVDAARGYVAQAQHDLSQREAALEEEREYLRYLEEQAVLSAPLRTAIRALRRHLQAQRGELVGISGESLEQLRTEVRGMSRDDLLEVPNLGPKGVSELQRWAEVSA
jgi:outer membrane PBP1 activator LpoA protein